MRRDHRFHPDQRQDEIRHCLRRHAELVQYDGPPPVAIFPSSYDFSGKTLIPFVTHGEAVCKTCAEGGGLQDAVIPASHAAGSSDCSSPERLRTCLRQLPVGKDNWKPFFFSSS
ncbi:MAG: hypothetical protein AB7F40_03405 [Victivallaceae bacterium]